MRKILHEVTIIRYYRDILYVTLWSRRYLRQVTTEVNSFQTRITCHNVFIRENCREKRLLGVL